MKRICVIMIACTFVVAGFFPAGAEAGACDAPARQLVAEKPAMTLLSVNAVTRANGQIICVARIRVAPDNGKPPRILKRRFRP